MNELVLKIFTEWYQIVKKIQGKRKEKIKSNYGDHVLQFITIDSLYLSSDWTRKGWCHSYFARSTSINWWCGKNANDDSRDWLYRNTRRETRSSLDATEGTTLPLRTRTTPVTTWKKLRGASRRAAPRRRLATFSAPMVQHSPSAISWGNWD